MSADRACDQVTNNDDEEKKYAYATLLSSCQIVLNSIMSGL